MDGEWATLYATVSWFLWKNHNDFIFNQSSNNSYDLIALDATWAKSLKVNCLTKQWACMSMTRERWQFLANGWVEVNVDGSVSMNGTRVAIGGAIRGPNEGWLVRFEIEVGMIDIFQVEGMIMIKGLKLA